VLDPLEPEPAATGFTDAADGPAGTTVLVDDAVGAGCAPVEWVGDTTLVCSVVETGTTTEAEIGYRAVEIDADAVPAGGGGEIGPVSVGAPIVPSTDRGYSLLDVTDDGELILLVDGLGGEPGTLFRASVDRPGEEPEEIGPLADDVPPDATPHRPHRP
jgi:hypothetical protein